MNTAVHNYEFSLIVPTFNELENIHELYARVKAVLKEISWELIIVDDDSTDGTAEAVKKIAKQDPRVKCIHRIGRRGLSTACIEGFMLASSDIVGVMDGDLQHDESILPAMIDKIRNGSDVVVGTRYSDGGSVGEWSKFRVKLSRIATRVSEYFVKNKTSDPMSGFFVIKREVVTKCVHSLSGLGYKILLDFLATSNVKLNIGEVAYTFRPRTAGESKLDHMVIWEYGMLLLDKKIGHIVPVTFLSFGLIGASGIFVHMLLLSVLFKLMNIEFFTAQLAATFIAMIYNFSVNNILTYRDRRLTGLKWFGGLATFVLACSIGAIANVGVANYLHSGTTQWALAAIAGVCVGSVWNYVITQVYTWKK